MGNGIIQSLDIWCQETSPQAEGKVKRFIIIGQLLGREGGGGGGGGVNGQII